MRRSTYRDVPDGLAYDEVYTAGRDSRWWSFGGICAALGLFLGVQVGVVLVFTGYYALTDHDHLNARITALGDFTTMTPEKFLFINLSLVLTIPFMWLCTFVFHGIDPRYLTSVAARIRWAWLAVSMGIALLTLVIAIALSSVLPASGSSGGDLSGSLNSFTHDTLLYALMVVLLTPLQSAAEEFVFRGYLTQAFGALVRRRWVSVLAPALLFALAHSPQPFTAFVDRFLFGIVSGILVIATGGLEAGIGYHVVNNVMAFGSALAFTSMTATFNLTEGGWSDVVVSFVKSAIFVALTVVVARRMGVANRTGPGRLVTSVARV